LGYSVDEFCASVGISVSYFYELQKDGKAPRAMRLGVRRIISAEEAQRWCAERTTSPVASIVRAQGEVNSKPE
jgi:predicted DNA-binding transcriptional regulator AlpA